MKAIAFIILSFLAFNSILHAKLYNPFSIQLKNNVSGQISVCQSGKIIFHLYHGRELKSHLDMYIDQAKREKKMLDYSGLVGGTMEDISMLDR